MISSEIREMIAENALVSCGEHQPWQAVLSKKQLTLAFLGGSITQGYANYQFYEKPYPALLTDALNARGYDAKCHVLASAGMDTMQGNALCEREIIVHSPDIVFLEYAINETTLRHSVISFESLLRRFLLLEHPPIVVIFTLRSANEYSCESYMHPIAEYYGLPCVSLQKGLNPLLADGTLTWEDYADRESHPTLEGHQLLADCLLHLLDTAKNIEDTEVSQKSMPEPWLDAPYTKLQFYPAGDLAGAQTDFNIEPKEFSYYKTVWVGDAAKEQTFRFALNAKALVVFYESHRAPQYGSAKILLDDAPVSHPLLNQSVMHCNSIYGWGNAMPIVLFDHPTAQQHCLTITPLEEKTFLVGFGIVW